MTPPRRVSLSAYLAVFSSAAGPGQELEKGQEQPQTQAQSKQQEEAAQVVGLQRVRGVCLIRAHATAGPPLLPQVR